MKKEDQRQSNLHLEGTASEANATMGKDQAFYRKNSDSTLGIKFAYSSIG